MVSVINPEVRVNAQRAIWVTNASNSAPVIGMVFNVPKNAVVRTAVIAIMCPVNVHALPGGLVHCAWISVRLERTAKHANRSANVRTAVSAMRRRVVVIVRRGGRAMCVRIVVRLVTLERDVKKSVSALMVLIAIT